MPSVVARPALFALLSATAAGGVALVAAPAGSGKTVLIRSWIEDAGLSDRVAWVSIDRGERDAQRFWLSVVGRLREVEHTQNLFTQLAPTPDFDGEALVDRLLSELGALQQPLVLVIDDLHELHSPEALAQLDALLTRRPPLLPWCWQAGMTRNSASIASAEPAAHRDSRVGPALHARRGAGTPGGLRGRVVGAECCIAACAHGGLGGWATPGGAFACQAPGA